MNRTGLAFIVLVVTQAVAYRAAWKMARSGMNADYREFVDSKLKGVASGGSR